MKWKDVVADDTVYDQVDYTNLFRAPVAAAGATTTKMVESFDLDPDRAFCALHICSTALDGVSDEVATKKLGVFLCYAGIKGSDVVIKRMADGSTSSGAGPDITSMPSDHREWRVIFVNRDMMRTWKGALEMAAQNLPDVVGRTGPSTFG